MQARRVDVDQVFANDCDGLGKFDVLALKIAGGPIRAIA